MNCEKWSKCLVGMTIAAFAFSCLGLASIVGRVLALGAGGSSGAEGSPGGSGLLGMAVCLTVIACLSLVLCCIFALVLFARVGEEGRRQEEAAPVSAPAPSFPVDKGNAAAEKVAPPAQPQAGRNRVRIMEEKTEKKECSWEE